MVKTTNFVVEGRLTQLLGENYISVEHALKELVDNAWDADATNVFITLPQSLNDSERFISIVDDGTGMSEDAVINEYMRIARDRVSSKGDRTEVKKRLVKGRKGIGKFAGLLVADKMSIITVQNGVQIQFQIVKNEFLNQHENMTSKEIDMIVIKDNALPNGTKVELNDLIILSLTPNDDKLRQLLVLEYGRESDFNILINGIPLTVEDVGGKNYKFVDDQERIDLNFNIANKEVKNKQSGIVLRVAGKIIGKPHYWGIEDLNYIHDKLLKKVYGEVNADFLEPYTSNSWAILESTLDYEHVNDFVKEKVLFALNDSFEAYINHTKKKLEREINKQVEKLPIYKRQKALKLIDKVLTGLSDGRHSEQQIKNIIAVTISALENDDYYEIIEKLAESNDTNIEMFADILKEFGLLDVTDNEIERFFNSQREDFEKLLITAKNGEPIRVWKSNTPFSACAFAFLCDALRNIECKISMISLPEYWEISGDTIQSCTDWSELLPGQFYSFLPLEREMTNIEKRLQSSLWNDLKAENAPLRALVNGKLISVPEDFYDHIITKNIPDREFVMAQLIGTILGKYHLGVGDGWYALRIKMMIADNQLEVVADKDASHPYGKILRKVEL